MIYSAKFRLLTFLGIGLIVAVIALWIIQSASFLENVEDLTLQGNRMTDFYSEGLPSLRTLNLDGNLLTKFSGHTLNKLRWLNLDNNLMSEFKNNHIPSLDGLWLSINKLSLLDVRPFPQLYILKADLNPHMSKITISSEQWDKILASDLFIVKDSGSRIAVDPNYSAL